MGRYYKGQVNALGKHRGMTCAQQNHLSNKFAKIIGHRKWHLHSPSFLSKQSDIEWMSKDWENFMTMMLLAVCIASSQHARMQ